MKGTLAMDEIIVLILLLFILQVWLHIYILRNKCHILYIYPGQYCELSLFLH